MSNKYFINLVLVWGTCFVCAFIISLTIIYFYNKPPQKYYVGKSTLDECLTLCSVIKEHNLPENKNYTNIDINILDSCLSFCENLKAKERK